MNTNDHTDFNYNLDAVSEELKIRPEILKKLVISFSKTLSEKIQALEEALKADDVIKMRALLHEIRGTSGNLRLESIATTGRIMHEAVKSENQKEKIHEYFDALKAQTHALGYFIARMENQENVENPHS